MDLEAQKEKAAQEMVEAYKISEECHKAKVAFLEATFTKGMDDTQRRVLDHYAGINLSFLDKDEDDQAKGAPTTGAIETLGPPESA